MPSILITILSWVSFWINYDASAARVALGTKPQPLPSTSPHPPPCHKTQNRPCYFLLSVLHVNHGVADRVTG